MTVRLTADESETVERAHYEARSYEALMSVLCRQLNAEANTETAEMLKYYAERYREAQMKLKLAQDMALSAHINLAEYPNARYIYDFRREEVRFVENEKTA